MYLHIAYIYLSISLSLYIYIYIYAYVYRYIYIHIDIYRYIDALPADPGDQRRTQSPGRQAGEQRRHAAAGAAR